MPGRWATASDFFGGRVYDEYRHFEYFGMRAEWILRKWPTVVGQKVCVVGCGPGGFLVQELVDRGVNAFGIDAYAKNPAHGIVTIVTRPDIAARCIMDADTTNNSDVARIKGNQYAKITGQSKFFLIVTDDVLPALPMEWITPAIDIIQSNTTNALHILTCNRNPDATDPEHDITLGYNWLTRAAWRSLITAAGGATHTCIDAGAVFTDDGGFSQYPEF